MALTMLLFVVGGLIGLAAWIWLVVVAFRVSTGWGVVILLLSWTWVPVIIFAVQHWDMAKRPVLLTVASVVVTVAASLVAFLVVGVELGSAMLAGDATTAPEAGDATGTVVLPPPRPTAAPTHPSWESVVEEMDRDAGASWETFVPSPTPVQSGRRTLSWDRCASRIGRLIELDLANNTTVIAVLEAIEPNRLRVRHSIGGGEASYWIERDQIVSIRIPE
jgi:hypothetical protein